jgi:putative transposase
MTPPKIQVQVRKTGPPEELQVESVFELYKKVFHAGYFEQLSQELGIKTGKKVFNWSAVIYGMLLQRLNTKGTMNAALTDLIPILEMFSDHKRVKEGTVSTNPGGFGRARGRMPMSMAERSFDHLFESLDGEGENASNGDTAFLLDGSTVTLEPSEELTRAYPPARNQHGASHWPIMRVVVAHDLKTGLASRPVYAPMSVSEQVLAEQLIPRLPVGSSIVADRNFGIFATAYQAVQTGHPVVFRMTESRAKVLGGLALNCGADQKVVWKPSAYERRSHSFPADAQISGRLLVRRIEQGGKPVKLYIFTTCDQSADEIVILYGRRWNIETDLRSLKRTVRLHALKSRTVDMVAKELVVGVAAYNLVHTIMEAAAQKAGLEPRELSFSYAQDYVYAALPYLMNARSPRETKKRLQQLLRQVASCKLPKRKKRRSYPRKVWLRRRSFPTHPTKGRSTNV